jgi:hypothetical protein
MERSNSHIFYISRFRPTTFNQILKTRYTATIYINESWYNIVAMVLINIFTLTCLWLVVEYGQKGHWHGQPDERQLNFLLVVHKLLNL